MSVLTPVVLTWDGANRRIYLKSGVSDYFPIEDLYHEYRNARRTDESLRKFEALIKAEGNVSKGAGAFTPRYVVLLDGTKIIPFNESLQINQLGDIITDDPDVDPTLYDISGLTTAKPIFIKPSEAETIQLNSEAIVFSSFQGAVWIDVNSVHSDKGSAVLPNGNAERPVSSMALALEIAVERGIKTFRLMSSLAITEDLSGGYNLIGESPMYVVTAATVADLTGVSLTNLTVQGDMDGLNVIRGCAILTISNVSGFIEKCAFTGDIDLGNNALVMECYSNVAGSGYPTLTASSGGTVQVRDFHGSVGLRDIVDGQHSIGVYGGRVVLEPTCTGGTIHVRGTAFEIVDNSGVGCTVIDERGDKETKAIVNDNQAFILST